MKISKRQMTKRGNRKFDSAPKGEKLSLLRNELSSLEVQKNSELNNIVGGVSRVSLSHDLLQVSGSENCTEGMSGLGAIPGSDPNWAQIAAKDEAEAQAARSQGKYASAAEDLDGAASAYSHLGQIGNAAGAYNAAGQCFIYSGNGQGAAAAYSNAASEYTQSGNLTGAANASSNAGVAFSMIGDNAQAAAAYETAGHDFKTLGDYSQAAAAYENAAGENCVNEYQDYMKAANIYANNLGDARDAASAYRLAGTVTTANLNERCQAMLDAENMDVAIGATSAEASDAAFLGSLLYQMGSYVESGQQYLKAAKLSSSLGDSALNDYAASGQSFAAGNDLADAGRAYFNEALIYRSEGKVLDAAQTFDLAGSDAMQGGANMTSARSYLDAGILYEDLGNLNQALMDEKNSVTVFNYVLQGSPDSLEALEGEAHAYAAEADVLYKQGNLENAGLMDMQSGNAYKAAAELGKGDSKELWQGAAEVYLSAKMDFTSTGDYVNEANAQLDYENAETEANS